MVDELIQKQSSDRLGIGWIDGQKLEVIAFGTKLASHEFTLSAKAASDLTAQIGEHNRPAAIGSGTDAQLSPDGSRMTYRTSGNKFVLADSRGTILKTLLDGQKILTPLYWSPQSEYLLYVEKAGTWESGFCSKNLADGRDIMVYRMRDGEKGIVYQVCDGFPYGKIGWLRLPPGAALPR